MTLKNIIKRLSVFAVLVTLVSFALAEDYSSPRISMDFQDADLKDVLKVFSQQAGLNFIASENVKDRKITLYLDKVTVQDALDTIMRANNLTYEQLEGSNIFVVKEWGRPKVETVTKVFYLKFARVSGSKLAQGTKDQGGIKATLEKLLTEHGQIVEDARTNSVIITDISSQFKVIEETIAKLDMPSYQIMIEVEVVETAMNLAEDLGLEWGGSLMAFRGASRATHFPLGKSLNPSGSAPSLSLGTLSTNEFSFTLDLLSTDTETRILARPMVLTLNNEPAEIKIAGNTAVGVVATYTESGSVATEEAERVETGISLKVTPQVNEDGYITMLIEPAVTDVVTTTRAISSTKTFYDTQTRSAKTVVMVKDGDTVVIGGLISTNESEVVKRVPLLGDIPLVGLLFRHKNIDTEDKELIIFITPHIVKEPSMPLEDELEFPWWSWEMDMVDRQRPLSLQKKINEELRAELEKYKLREEEEDLGKFTDEEEE